MLQLADKTFLMRLDMAAAALDAANGSRALADAVGHANDYAQSYNALLDGLADVWADPDGQLYCRPMDVAGAVPALFKHATWSYLERFAQATDKHPASSLTKVKGVGAVGPAPSPLPYI